jgi:hypothetical protein
MAHQETRRKLKNYAVGTAMDASEYTELVKATITQPPPSKRIWKTGECKLSLTYMECRDLDIIKWNLWNLAWIYGGGDVSLYIHCSTVNVDRIKEYTEDWYGVTYVIISEDSGSHSNICTIYTRPDIWRTYKSQFTLVNSWDSLLLKRIPDSMFEYTYIGAPWIHGYVSSDIPGATSDNPECDIGTAHSSHRWRYCKDARDKPHAKRVGNGGFVFHSVAHALGVCENISNRGRVPSDILFGVLHASQTAPVSVAEQFSVEATEPPAELPVGCHAIYRYQTREYVLRALQSII